MVKSLYTGVSGMKTHQQKMDVIGNNIANVNTTGYKTNVVTFADVYYQTKKSPSGASTTKGGINPIQVGYGVKLNSTTPNMTQSGFTFSDSIYDMAIDGEGFFQVMDAAGNTLYTRAGIFNVDEEGNLVNASGYKVLGVSGDFDGQPAGSQPIKITIPATDAKCSSATKTINGCDVTISVSDPSDNTDMSVTFNQAEYPFATYSSGVLNLFFVWKYSPQKPRYIQLFVKPVFASAVMGAAAWAVCGLVSRVLSGHSAYGVNALATFCGILAGVVVYGILVIALRILRAEDVKSLPKGEKIAKLLHLK